MRVVVRTWEGREGNGHGRQYPEGTGWSDEANRAGDGVSGMQTAQEACLCPVALALERPHGHDERGAGVSPFLTVCFAGEPMGKSGSHTHMRTPPAHHDPASHEMTPTMKLSMDYGLEAGQIPLQGNQSQSVGPRK